MVVLYCIARVHRTNRAVLRRQSMASQPQSVTNFRNLHPQRPARGLLSRTICQCASLTRRVREALPGRARSVSSSPSGPGPGRRAEPAGEERENITFSMANTLETVDSTGLACPARKVTGRHGDDREHHVRTRSELETRCFSALSVRGTASVPRTNRGYS